MLDPAALPDIQGFLAQLGAERAEIARLARAAAQATDPAVKSEAVASALDRLRPYTTPLASRDERASLAALRAREEAIAEVANRIDVRTELPRVLWSGARAQAAAWASRHGAATLDQTAALVLHDGRRIGTLDTELRLFGILSRRYLRGAKGTVHLFLNEERWAQGGGALWRLYERPALLAGGGVTAVVHHRVDEAGNLLGSSMEWLAPCWQPRVPVWRETAPRPAIVAAPSAAVADTPPRSGATSAFERFLAFHEGHGRARVEGYSPLQLGGFTPDERAQAAELLSRELTGSPALAAEGLVHLDADLARRRLEDFARAHEAGGVPFLHEVHFHLHALTGDEAHVGRMINSYSWCPEEARGGFLERLSTMPSTPEVLTFLVDRVLHEPDEVAQALAARQLLMRSGKFSATPVGAARFDVFYQALRDLFPAKRLEALARLEVTRARPDA